MVPHRLPPQGAIRTRVSPEAVSHIPAVSCAVAGIESDASMAAARVNFSFIRFLRRFVFLVHRKQGRPETKAGPYGPACISFLP
jgi:hypothetical protein